MYIGILLNIGKTQKQPRCPSLGEIMCTSRKWDIIHCPKAMNSEAMEKTGRKLKYVLLNERSNLERQNYGDSKHTGKKMGGPEQFERGRDRQSTEDFQGAETILYDTEMIDICYYSFKNHKMYNTKSEPYYKLQTLVDNDVLMWVHQW